MSPLLRSVAVVCVAALAAVFAAPLAAQEVTQGLGGVLRVLDKNNGTTFDIELGSGEGQRVGFVTIRLGECSYPTDNPSGDAFTWLTISYQGVEEPVFRGWMIASNPAVSAMQHPRYDVWALRCITS